MLAPRTNAYYAKHQQLKMKRGSASDQLCEGGCGGKAHDWANVHGTEDYVPLCVNCHREYDYGTTCPKGHDVKTYGRVPSGGCRVCHRLDDARRTGRSPCNVCGLARCQH